MKWIFISNKGEDVRRQTGIIVLPDLNCRGYCFILSRDNFIPRRLVKKKKKNTLGFESDPLVVTSAQSVVKLSQGRGTVAADVAILGRLSGTLPLGSSHLLKTWTEPEQHFKMVLSFFSLFFFFLKIIVLDYCEGKQNEVAIIIPRLALERAFEESGAR